MQNFTISEAERLTGIKAHTLRMWEQRYGLLAQQERQPNTHRTYSNEDMRKLLQVAHLYAGGMRISRIAAMAEEEWADRIALEVNEPIAYDEVVRRLLQASADMDDAGFMLQLKWVNLKLGIRQGMLQVVYPFLERLGLLWMNGSLLPAQEHFASHHIRNFLLLAIDELPRPEPVAGQPCVLLFTPQEEYHEIPLLFIHYLMKSHGVPVWYAGAHVDTATLRTICEVRAVRVLHYHHITNFTQLEAVEYLEQLCLDFPRQQVVVSGGLLTGSSCSMPNGTIITSLQHLLDYCQHPLQQQGSHD